MKEFLYIFSLMAFIFLSSVATAGSYKCVIKENGYRLGAAGMSGKNMNDKINGLKTWFPESFVVDSKFVRFTNGFTLNVTGGNRTTKWQMTRRMRTNQNKVLSANYRLNINEFSEAGTFFASVVGYQNLGPIKYNCKALNKNKAVISENNNSTIKTQFMEMTSCNRKFLQLVLSEGGLLDTSIDGNWNNKMEEAIMNFMKRPELKGFPPSDLFQALEEESICD